MKHLPLTPEQNDWRLKRLKANYMHRDTMSIATLCRGECNTIAPKFAEAFGLTAVAGFCNHQEHVWCKDSKGNIIDPTAEQFSEPRIYREVDPDKDEVRVGRCPNCGEYIYSTINNAKNGKVRTDIHEECIESYSQYIEAEAKGFSRRYGCD